MININPAPLIPLARASNAFRRVRAGFPLFLNRYCGGCPWLGGVWHQVIQGSGSTPAPAAPIPSRRNPCPFSRSSAGSFFHVSPLGFALASARAFLFRLIAPVVPPVTRLRPGFFKVTS